MRNSKKKSRIHIGVLLSSLEENCQSKIWQGIEDLARKEEIDLTIYLSTFQQRDGLLKEHYAVVFDAVRNNETLDGLILFGGFIAEDTSSDDVRQFVENCGDLPIVSLAMSFPNTPSLLVDNRSGIYNVITHLIEQHQYSKIAFVKGPEGHEEADARYSGYCDALNDANIPLDQSYIFQGHFSDWSGEEAVTELYDIRKIDVEVIACADDETAIGVIKELSRRNITIPRDVAVCGFDDEEHAEIITPSLTTAQQPFYELGRESLQQILRLVTGQPVSSLQLLTPELIIRQSCGCLAGVDHQALSGTETLQNAMKIFSQTIFSNAIPLSVVHNWIKNFTHHNTDSFSRIDFLHHVNNALIEYKKYDNKFVQWRSFFAQLLVEFRKLTLTLDEYANRAEAILQAVELVAHSEDRCRRYMELENGEAQWEVRGIAQQLATSFDLRTLADNLKNGAKELGIETAMVFLYNEPQKYSSWEQPQSISYITGFDKNGIITNKPKEIPIPFDEIVSFAKATRSDEMSTLFYMPLFFGDEQLGVMLMSYTPDRQIDIYEPIRLNVATALKGSTLFEKIKKQSVTDEMTNVYNRRGFITFSLSRFAHLRRSRMKSALFFIDMDGLKKINDTYGHQAGDAAIVTCAEILKSSFREGDIIGRMGGDEFTVLASELDKRHTEIVKKRLRNGFKKFNETSGLPYEINCSMGVEHIEDYSEETFESALQKADDLLYEEKMEKKAKGLSRE